MAKAPTQGKLRHRTCVAAVLVTAALLSCSEAEGQPISTSRRRLYGRTLRWCHDVRDPSISLVAAERTRVRRPQSLLETAANTQAELPTRLGALDALAGMHDKALTLDLKKLLARPKPDALRTTNWDPMAPERIVDVNIVRVLSLLGDDSQLYRLPVLVRGMGARGTLDGPVDELDNATSAILRIGRVEPIQGVIAMTKDPSPQAVRNAVTVLRELHLPLPPVGGDVPASLREGGKRFTFEITSLKQELEKIAALSDGGIVLSPGTKSLLGANDYDRGEVRRNGVSLGEILEKDLPVLDFSYYVTDKTVVICTLSEAGQRWRNWWGTFGTKLIYRDRIARFELTSH
jgi:hypothetical protein